MIEKLLATCLRPILLAEAQLRQRRVVISVLFVGTVGFLILLTLAMTQDWWSWPAVFGWFGALAVAALIGITRARREPDMRELARKVEENHPDLQAALLAAMDQKPGPDGELSFLQRRLLSDVTEHALKHQWVRQVSHRRLVGAAWAQFAALIAFCFSVWFLLGQAPGAGTELLSEAKEEEETMPTPASIEVAVSPGDVELEKGSRLVVEATFRGRAPATAMIHITDETGERKIPMTVGLDDSVFSALIPKIDLASNYRVAFEKESSEEFAVTVFEFPALQQADALITPPAYLDEKPREVNDTRKITVMEGSRIEWTLQLNKPVAMGELFGEDEVSIPLQPDPADPTRLLATHVPEQTQRYRVHLIDENDRSNKRPPWITVNVKENTPPDLKLTFPGRDFEVSAIQELPVEAEAWDDVGIEKAGFAFQHGEDETSITLSDSRLEGGETHSLSTQIDVEKLGAEPRQLLTYYFWAEDRDKDGNIRRTTSDLFFSEVRFFEEIIREGQPQSGQGQGQQGSADELLKIQKDVINAAWKLRRYHDLGREFDSLAPDVEVVQESQSVVITMVDPVLEKIDDAELRQIYTDAKALMEKAASEFALVLTERDGDLIAPAHQTARAVFAKLLEARSREQEIAMSKSQSSGQSQQQQQQNMNLELKQKELKYEEQRMAQEEQSAEQQENLAVLNRLKELARRQEAIAEKIKELQNQLEDADEEERAEIERQLKRLQEEQRELLREIDDLSERMDSEQNRANMAEEREKLEETRENAQEAAENLEEGNLADAANSATRAQRELEEMEEEFRERTSRQFADEMRDIRDTARRIAENQEAIGEALNELTDTDDSDPFASDNQQERGQLAEAMNEQAKELGEMLEEMKRLSEEAEPSEPILSDALYEAVRNSMMNGIEKSLSDARTYTFYNRPNQALEPEQAAARGIEELKDAVEAAAETVLGNEADALRMARSELDRLIEDSKAEAQRLAEQEQPGQSGETAGENAEQGESPTPGEGETGELASKGEQGKGQGESESREPGKGEQGEGQLAEKGEQPGSGDSPGEPGEQGKGSENGEKGKGSGKGEEPQPGQGEGQVAEKGQQPGQGKGGQPKEGQQPGAGEEPGQGKEGKGKGGKGDPQSLAQGQQPGQGQPADNEGGQKGKSKGKGESPSGEGGEPGEGQQGEPRNGQPQLAGNGNGQRRVGLSVGGDDRGGGMPTSAEGGGQVLFFQQSSEQRQTGPITGEDYKEFRDRLGNVEEMLQQEDLRNEVARIADNARAMRIDYSRDNLPPGAATIEQRITDPLVELRQRISEEIAKLNKENPIAPIDRDPVPSEFRDLVRRYYEELGAGK